MKIKESEIKNILYPLNNCSKCSYTRYYVVFHGSLDWGLKICISFQLDLKRVYTTKNRNESTICHLFSRRRLSHNHRVEKASLIKPICFYG